MKRLVIVLALVIGCGSMMEVSAQLTKQEMKDWKKRIKQLQPEQYKNLLDENKSLQSENLDMKNRLDSFEGELSSKDDQIDEYESQIKSLRNEVAATKKQAEEAAANNIGGGPVGQGGPVAGEKGVVFRVQIGAFTKKEDLTKYTNGSFNAEKNDSLQKFTLGAFRDYWEADTFKKYLREMGVKDAWIVSFKDGNRVPVKDVLEGVI